MSKAWRLSKSVIGEREKEAVNRVLTVGYLGMGPEVGRFERDIQTYLGTPRQVVCVSSGTAALHLAMQAIGCGPGDEVLVPSLTFLSTFQAIRATGAIPVACDARLESGLLDLQDAEKRLTSRTKAIVPVHYASETSNWAAVYAFAEKHKLRVVEDAAHAFGCTNEGTKIGAKGDVVCFSFDGIKNITSGEGGAVVSADPKVIQRVQDARLLGIEKDSEKRIAGQRSWEFEVREVGWRYHMSEIMAAIGRVQLERFESEFKPKRQALLARYRQLLQGTAGLTLLEHDAPNVVAHIFPLRVHDGKRDLVKERIETSGVPTGMHYKPNHLLEFFGAGSVSLPHTERLYTELMTLPLHPDLELEDVDAIVKILKDAL